MANFVRRLTALGSLCAGIVFAAACSSGSPSAPDPLPVPPAGDTVVATPPPPANHDKLLIVSDSMKNEIIALPPYASSSTTPVWVAHVVVGGTAYFPLNSARDSAGRLYVTMRRYPGIAVFDNPSSSPASADAVIAGPRTDLIDPVGIAVDAAGNIYVADQGGSRIIKFPSGARGDVAPLAVITGSNTKVSSPLNVAVDASGTIFVADLRNGILEFSPNANGNVAPVRIIGPLSSSQVALGSNGNIYVSDLSAQAIFEFAHDASGPATPIRILGGTATQIRHPWALAICSDETLYVADGEISPTSLRKILVFAPGWGIDTPPRADIQGGASQVTAPFGLGFY